MLRKEEFTLRRSLAAALLLSASLTACGSGSGGSSGTYRGDLSEVEINRIGDLKQSDVEFQNIAMRNAVGHAEAHQVPAEAIERITIVGNESLGPSPSNSKLGRLNRRTSYRLWIDVAGCDQDVMYTASPAGRLTSVTDEGKCLTARAGRPDSEEPGIGPAGGGQSF